MIKSNLVFLFFPILFIIFPVITTWDGYVLSDKFTGNAYHVEEILLLSLVTTSTSSSWSPVKVTSDGNQIEWRASAEGMPDQIVQTSASPVFDLSVQRNSDVTITASTINGQGNVIELIINSLNINALSLDNSPDLSILSCTDNQIKSLNLQNTLALTDLFCHSNQISNLDITQNINLINLACFSNQIEEIDVSNNLILATLSCSRNLLKNLDLSNNGQLIALECDFNQLENLNIQNGNNTIVQKFNSKNNLDLTCIQVDDAAYSKDNWIDIDPWTTFNKDCSFINDPPVANDDFYRINENEGLDVMASEGVLINDFDPDDDILMAILQEGVSHGQLDILADGSLQYIPDAGYFGTDTFTYVANDGEFDSNVAIVTIEILMANQSPVANNNSYITQENSSLYIDVVQGVLSNDKDPDGDMLVAELLNQVNHGELNFSPDGSFTYVPNLDFFGVDSFTYIAFDGYAYSNEAEVTINVEAVSELIVPNAFTPNNDGLNDTFRPSYMGMKTVEILIFDTWGTLIYQESGEILSGWDGNINNKAAENGNYLYRIEALTNTSEILKQEGLFTLIK